MIAVLAFSVLVACSSAPKECRDVLPLSMIKAAERNLDVLHVKDLLVGESAYVTENALHALPDGHPIINGNWPLHSSKDAWIFIRISLDPSGYCVHLSEKWFPVSAELQSEKTPFDILVRID